MIRPGSVGSHGSDLPWPGLSRRQWLATTALLGMSSFRGTRPLEAALETGDAADTIAKYVKLAARPDGGFAWDDQPASHLTPTWAALGCLHRLRVEPPEPSRHADFVRNNHPAAWKKLEQEHREFEFQQIQSLLWLDADASEFRDRVRAWTKPVPYLKQYEQHQYPVFRFQLTAFTCRALLGLPLDDIDREFHEYLDSRRRANGSFNNTPASDGADGHVLNTLWGLQALEVLGRNGEKRDETKAWVNACRGRWQPGPAMGDVVDMAYLWGAVRCLALLKGEPTNREELVHQIRACWNEDGGFAPRPGWASNVVATYYAVDALLTLGALGTRPTGTRPPRKPTEIPDDAQVFSAQIEAHGQGSPQEAVDLARSLRIHLWGAKNAKPGWIETAQAIADREKVPVTFFVANEEYGTWVDFPGLGTYSHTSDLIAPAGADLGTPLTNAGVVSWQEFHDRRVKPLSQANGTLFWQFGENEELTRIVLDESLLKGGFGAISTFHFGNPDFTNSEPFLKHYRGQLPFVALQDAHGQEPWWFSDMTTGFRTLFVAREATWDGFRRALAANHVVAVRRDENSRGMLRMHGGTDAAVQFIRQREDQWRWWDNPAITRPMLSLVAVRPEDQFEAGRPEAGVALRVRCAWVNTTQGQPKLPLVDFVGLEVDGEQVMTRRVELKGGRNRGVSDVYHLWQDGGAATGPRFAKAVGRVRSTGAEVVRELRF